MSAENLQPAERLMGKLPLDDFAAAVRDPDMSFRGGKITRIEFHLDREVAMRSAALSE